jgi:hypothetical protein
LTNYNEEDDTQRKDGQIEVAVTKEEELKESPADILSTNDQITKNNPNGEESNEPLKEQDPDKRSSGTFTNTTKSKKKRNKRKKKNGNQTLSHNPITATTTQPNANQEQNDDHETTIPQ